MCRCKLQQVFRVSPVDIARRGEVLQRIPIRVVLSLLLPFDPRVSLAPACQRRPGRTGLAQRARFLRRVPDFLAESELEDTSRAVILSSSLAPCKCKSDRAVNSNDRVQPRAQRVVADCQPQRTTTRALSGLATLQKRNSRARARAGV